MRVLKLLPVVGMALFQASCANGVVCGANTMLSSDGTTCTATGGGLTCGTGTSQMGTMCVATGGNTCGTNTAAMGGMCQVTASACITGTTFDAPTFTCKPTGVDYGTMIVTGTFQPVYGALAYDSGGGMLMSAADGFTTPKAGLPDTTGLFTGGGRKLGGQMLMLKYPDRTVPVATAEDPAVQVTLGDYKACQGSVTFYKPATGTKYRMIVDIAGCLTDHLYTVWLFYSPDDPSATPVDMNFADRALAAPPGGVPNAIMTNALGQGHMDRYIDPSVYLKFGQPCPFCGTHGAPTFPAGPKGSLMVTLFNHVTAQTNGNANGCALIKGGNGFDCATMASQVDPVKPFNEVIVVPGNIPDETVPTNIVALDWSKLQPF